MAAPQPVPENYSQPTLATPRFGYPIMSIDQQITTKSSGWNQDQTKRRNEADAIKNLLKANFTALAVPYDDLTKYTNYVADARLKGLKVWHRSHWNRWQGDNGTSANLSWSDYCNDTYDFFVNNPTLVQDGDAVTWCVEMNNADGVNSTNPFRTNGSFDMTKYKRALRDQITYANAAMSAINKSVRTDLLSVTLSLMDLSGQILDSGDGGNSSGFDYAEWSQYSDILTIDHYLSDSYRFTDATKYWNKFSSDLDKIHTAFPMPIMLGEWGYHTTTSVSESERAGMYREVIKIIRSKDYIYGVNFWNHMGQTSSSIFTDNSGTLVTDGRTIAREIRKMFTQGNETWGRRKVRAS